ncbi:Sensory transduction histidine kinase [Bradyrhizobium sp.]|uniref:sensor histidine kinase n=1 Tax=Bradyrhizobium sp. TaxID=376 RepID=UPI0007C1B99A|nr:sensor histidine kinase [Bradyrhizobium sp.]CUT09451.1 Sensory transduction histidine kinase [Bradyrhizobium sp.]
MVEAASAFALARRLSGQPQEITVNMSSPDPDRPQRGILLRELRHRVDQGIATAIDLVSAAVVRAEGAEAKAALSDVVELLHGHAELHRALAMPRGEALNDAATYIGRLGCALRRSLLERMGIRLAFTTESLPLQSERCWRLGLIVHDLIVNAAKHAYFDARSGEIKVKLSRIGSVANCVVLDNGSRPARVVLGRELQISNALAKELGGRIEHGYAAEFTSVVLSFHLSERERQASWSMATRRMRSPRSLKLRSSATAGLNSGLSDQIEPSAAMRTDPNSSSARPNEPDSSSRGPDVLGNLLSPSHRMDAL